MAELADAHGSGPCESDFMQVQVREPFLREQTKTACVNANNLKFNICALGGIGRRAWFRSMCQQWLGSSSLPGRTTQSAFSIRIALFLFLSI